MTNAVCAHTGLTEMGKQGEENVERVATVQRLFFVAFRTAATTTAKVAAAATAYSNAAAYGTAERPE